MGFAARYYRIFPTSWEHNEQSHPCLVCSTTIHTSSSSFRCEGFDVCAFINCFIKIKSCLEYPRVQEPSPRTYSTRESGLKYSNSVGKKIRRRPFPLASSLFTLVSLRVDSLLLVLYLSISSRCFSFVCFSPTSFARTTRSLLHTPPLSYRSTYSSFLVLFLLSVAHDRRLRREVVTRARGS